MSNRTLGPSQWSAPASVVLTLSFAVSGSGLGNFPVNLDNAEIDFSLFNIQSIDLASGNNTVNLPITSTDVKATAVIIIPPRGNTTAYTVRASGDTGVPENANWPFVIKSFSTTAPPTSIQVNAAAAIDGMIFIWV